MKGQYSLDRKLFWWMLLEEWRMHTVLFGGLRFALFPLLILALATGTVWAVAATGTNIATLYSGLHVLVLLFGLHTGSVGLVGRDAVRNLLGDVTLIVYSARTLPISKRRLLAIFLVKDVVYYSGLFIVPLSLAFLLPSLFGVGGSVSAVPLLWVTLTATFLLGASLTILFIGLSTRGASGRVVAGFLGVAVVVLWYLGVDVAPMTPYGLFLSPGIFTMVTGLAPIPVVAAIGVYLFEFSDESETRTTTSKLASWQNRVPGRNTGLVAKSLIDVSRSSGGFAKFVFSGGILFMVNAALIRLVESFLLIEPSVAVSMGAMLGLIAFTSYNWLTQFDDLDQYLIYPLDAADVFDAKMKSFLLTGLPVGIAYYLLAIALFGSTAIHAVVGFVLLLGFQLYLFGLTARLAGLKPNEFLFDTILFALFAGAVGLFLVPVLIVGLVITPLTGGLLLALGITGGITGVIGVALARTAASKSTAVSQS